MYLFWVVCQSLALLLQQCSMADPKVRGAVVHRFQIGRSSAVRGDRFVRPSDCCHLIWLRPPARVQFLILLIQDSI